MKKILAVSLIFFSVALSIIALAAPSARSTLKGSKPSWATSKNYSGAANASDKLGFRVYLGWNNPSGAEALARAVSDPKSKSYRHYLTPAQFRQQFAPTANQVAQVQSWLTSQGFTLVYTPKNNHYVSAQGSVGQAQAAFGVSFGNYNVKALKLTLRSPSADISVPSSLAGLISGVAGLDESYEFIRPTHAVGIDAPPSEGFRNSPPFSLFWGQNTSPYKYPSGFGPAGGSDPVYAPWNVRGHAPAQIKGAYSISTSTGCGPGGNSPCDGTGQTVAIIDAYASPTILQDVNQWSDNRTSADPTYPIPHFGAIGGGTLTQVVAPGTYNVPQNPAQDPQGWYGEETLDVESVHGMAPNAHIVYVGAPNNYQDLDAAMNHVVDQHLAQIVSNSYGFLGENVPFGFIKPFNDTLMQAAIEGIGVYFSSGDFGDESSVLGYASADWPASSPWVTSVGGTALGVSAAPYHRLVETGWGQNNYHCDTTTFVCDTPSFGGGGGGGVSCLFAQPDYQSAAGVPAAGAGTLCEGFAGRGVPDVAALGMPTTGFIVGQTQTFPDCPGGAPTCYDEYRLGGTSLSCPIVAGIMALSDQKAGGPAHAHGFANPFFYGKAGSGGPPSFTDITSVKTAPARRDFVNTINADDGTSDTIRTFDDYAATPPHTGYTGRPGSPTQFTGPGWDNVTGLGVFNGIP
jgi:subtilase family serine protease